MSDLLTIQTGVVAVLAGLALAAGWRDIRHFAFAWAFVLPVDLVDGVPSWVFDGLRYAGAAWLVLRVPADLPTASRPLLRRLAGLILVLAAVRAAMAVVNHDSLNVRYGVMMAVGTVAAYLLVLRTHIHRSAIAGYVTGLAFSAAVSVMQSRHWATITVADVGEDRYPGLSAYTSVFTWLLATGLIVGCYVIAAGAAAGHRDRQFWAAVVITPLCLLGLVSNGAQGGLVGVAAAAAAVSWAGRRRITRSKVAWVAVAGVAVVVVVGLATTVGGIDVPTLNDYDLSFHNEKARVESWQQGAREMRNHPLTGMSRHEYIVDRGHRIAPHFLPLESGAMAGVAGFVAAVAVVGYLIWLLARGPADRRGETLAAYGVLASLLANTLIDEQTPFLGVARAVPLFLAVLYASVPDRAPLPGPDPPEPDLPDPDPDIGEPARRPLPTER